jgi:adenylosuccinate synthase
MPATTVIGTQWGDEGKGKVLDLLSENADLVVRFQGGANAGHTVEAEGKRFVFHLLPSGVLHEGKKNVIGNGVVLDPAALLAEIDDLAGAGIDLAGRLFISGRTHVVMPYHKRFDAAREKMRTKKIGTTSRGIGPCYTDKMSRNGMRMYDLADIDRFRRKLEDVVPVKNQILEGAYGAEPIDLEEILDEYSVYSRRLAPFVADTGSMVRAALKEDLSVFFEGAQGTLLDIDHGTYPFVTSSNSCALGLAAGAGVPPRSVGHIIGVVKAYTTRVGEGPFPTEGDTALDGKLRTAGGEFGATTGRPRRCGWLDGVVLRYVSALNGLNALAVTKLDVLSGIEVLRVCTGYRIDGTVWDEFPADTDLLDRVEPVYDELPGWEEDISRCRSFADLPDNARSYVAYMESIAGVPAQIVSIGPGREQTIFRKVKEIR